MSSNAHRQRPARPAKRAGAARPRKPAGLALSMTLFAVLLTGAYVSRLSTSDGSAVALRPAVTQTPAVGDATPDPTSRASRGGSAGSAGQRVSWRPVDTAPHAVPAQRETPTPAPAAGPGTVTLDRVPGEWVSWALLNRGTGNLVAGGDAGTSSTESMVKAWIAADYLQGLGGREPRADETDLLRRMIRDSDDQAAQTLYQRRGGDAVMSRLISTCGLTDTRRYPGWWSLTQISARDTVRMGDCIADGKATSARWTAWLLGEMRQVRGEGRFGIVQERPGVAVKNGWTRWWDGTWHVNCLGVADGWSLAVLVRYPARLGLDHGAEVCRSVTRQLAP
ncbi:MAG TPA: serine hydrolase [Planosporangium sp.]|jgi:hypothetical protein|nr:serine hydrolase [Planosporangium sp.]